MRLGASERASERAEATKAKRPNVAQRLAAAAQMSLFIDVFGRITELSDT